MTTVELTNRYFIRAENNIKIIKISIDDLNNLSKDNFNYLLCLVRAYNNMSNVVYMLGMKDYKLINKNFDDYCRCSIFLDENNSGYIEIYPSKIKIKGDKKMTTEELEKLKKAQEIQNEIDYYSKQLGRDFNNYDNAYHSCYIKIASYGCDGHGREDVSFNESINGEELREIYAILNKRNKKKESKI